MTTTDTPPENQTGNTNNRRTNWILQLLFQLIVARLVYSLFLKSQKNVKPYNSGLYPRFNNFFRPGDLFDVYGVLTNDIRIDMENIEKNGNIIYVNKDRVYSHKFNNPYEGTKVRIKPSDKFFNDLNENLYLTVFVIPHKSYLTKEDVFYKSKFKEGIDGHYLVKTIPLTKLKKDTRTEEVHLMSSGTNTKGNDINKEEDNQNIDKTERGSKTVVLENRKYWLPRLDINLVYDEKEYTPMRNDIYFETFTKYYDEKIYDPVLYLSQFWVLDEYMVPIEPLSNFDEKHNLNKNSNTIENKEDKNKGNDGNSNVEELDKKKQEERDIDQDKVEKISECRPVRVQHSDLSEMQLLLSKDEGLLKRTEMLSEEVVVEKDKPFFKKFVFKKDKENKRNNKKDELDLNRTVNKPPEGELELLINYSTCIPMYYMMIQNVNANHTNNFMGIDNSKELDTIKKTILNTNIYYLIFSAVFILLHTVFSVFAFKNDIQFWYNNKSMEGLSTITMLINFISEVIIGLYVYDSEKSSFIILFEIFLSVASSFWKLTKAIKVKFVARYPFFVVVKQSSYIENKTKEYDKVAIKYMSILLAPCIVGYAIYSLYYHKHKSWYSYIISVLAGSVYTFGFIMMTPQLYINYKLKSVEHLPWRALIYKSLNTFVDDVASFLIDMPFLHRLSCFRDDIIFFCYLYQRWKYKVDPNRNNPNHIPEENQENKSKNNIQVNKEK